MKCITLATLISVLLTGIMAKPVCLENSEENSCKPQPTFFEVDCVERLKFKHARATCFMNTKDEFIIMSVNDRKLSKRSSTTDDEDSYSKLYGGRVSIQRIRRSADDFKAEVLSATELKDLLNKPVDINTESPLTTNEVLPGTGTTDTEPGVNNVATVGIIFVITTDDGGENNEVTGSQDTSLSSNGEEDMAEALFGLLLLGAILDEMKKHQIDNAEENASEEN